MHQRHCHRFTFWICFRGVVFRIIPQKINSVAFSSLCDFFFPTHSLRDTVFAHWAQIKYPWSTNMPPFFSAPARLEMRKTKSPTHSLHIKKFDLAEIRTRDLRLWSVAFNHRTRTAVANGGAFYIYIVQKRNCVQPF